MPDWLTHLGLAWILCRIMGVERRERSLVLVGALLPDLVKVAFFLDYFTSWYNAQMFAQSLHTPVGSLLSAVFLAPFFKREKMSYVLKYLILGIAVHLALDSLLWPWPQMDSGVLLFWPLSWKSYSLGIIWSDDPRPIVITLILVLLTLNLLPSKHSSKVINGKF